MSEKKEAVITLNLSVLMDKKTFPNFNDLRKEASSVIKDYRESFIKVILQKHGIVFSDNIPKRTFNELMEKHKIEITRDEKINRDEMHKNGELIAYWNRDIELVFTKGYLMCKIKCWSKK